MFKCCDDFKGFDENREKKDRLRQGRTVRFARRWKGYALGPSMYRCNNLSDNMSSGLTIDKMNKIWHFSFENSISPKLLFLND